MANDRIEQFRKMAEADPTNELGHFSLGREYLKENQPAQAVAAFEKALAINANLSAAYQQLATALLQQNQRDPAIARLTEGVKIANARGDMMPRDQMIKMLQELGAPIPEITSTQAIQPVGEGQVHCSRCGQVAPRLPSPPFRNAQGQMVFEKVCATCWREWIGMGTKVINELRLALNDPQAQRIYDQHMLEFLNLKT